MILARRIPGMRGALGRIVIALCLFSLALTLPFFFFILLFPERDPFDKFEVIAVEQELGSERYAATYRYHHANSSTDLFATWILPNSPPIGSTQPPAGRAKPVLVWTNGADVVARRWAGGQLVVTVAKGADRRPGRFDDCYSAGEYDLKNAVFEPQTVQVMDEAM